nr:MAG TPA: hypothetical protein [Bacteriophage sp.]
MYTGVYTLFFMAKSDVFLLEDVDHIVKSHVSSSCIV